MVPLNAGMPRSGRPSVTTCNKLRLACRSARPAPARPAGWPRPGWAARPDHGSGRSSRCTVAIPRTRSCSPWARRRLRRPEPRRPGPRRQRVAYPWQPGVRARSAAWLHPAGRSRRSMVSGAVADAVSGRTPAVGKRVDGSGGGVIGASAAARRQRSQHHHRHGTGASMQSVSSSSNLPSVSPQISLPAAQVESSPRCGPFT